MHDVDLTKPQAEFFSSKAKATAAVSGFGSGKTQATLYRLASTMMEYPGADMLYAAPTTVLIRDILWPKVHELFPQIGLDYTINKSEGIVHVHGLGKIFCRSMDSPERLVGFEVLDAFLDELDILATDKGLDVFRKCKARMRQKVLHPSLRSIQQFKNSKRKLTKKFKKLRKQLYQADPELISKKGYKKNQMFVSTTPEGFKATYELFKNNPISSSRLVEMSTYSNAHNLPDDYIDDLLESYPPALIKAYLLGKFVNLASDPVWTGYNTEFNNAPNIEPDAMKPLIIGMDFNVGRGCAVVYQWHELPIGHPNNPTSTPFCPETLKTPWRVLVAVKEVVNTMDTPETLITLDEYFPKTVFQKERIVFPDASGKSRKSVNATISDLTLVRDAGYQIKKPNKNSNIKDRVASSNAAYYNAKGETKVYVNKANCPAYNDGLVQQTYNKNGLPNKGEKKGDDITDAGTYPLDYLFPIKRRRIFTEALGGA